MDAPETTMLVKEKKLHWQITVEGIEEGWNGKWMKE